MPYMSIGKDRQEKRHCFPIWIPINCWKMCPLKLDKYVVDREFQHLRF